MFVACANRTMQGAARIAAQRGQAVAPELPAPEPQRAPLAVPEPVAPSNLVEKINMPENVVVPIRTPFAETRRIIDLIARMHGVKYAQVMSKSRNYAVTNARQAAMCALKEAYPVWSLPKVGGVFGRDHTTALHAMQRRGYR